MIKVLSIAVVNELDKLNSVTIVEWMSLLIVMQSHSFQFILCTM